MLEWRLGVMAMALLGTFLLCASLLMASAADCRMQSKPASAATAKGPCGPDQESPQVKVAVEAVQSVNCSSAEECFRLGQQYLDNGDSGHLAAQLLEKAVDLDPENAEAYKKLSLAYMRNDGTNVGRRSKEEYCRAETACRKAISLAPHDAEAFLLLGTILAGEVYNELRHDDSAVEAIKTAIELKPGWADAYCALAHACDLLKRYEEAATAYAEEARLRSEKQFEQGHSSTVLESEKDHNVVDAFVLAQIYTKLGKYDKSLTSLQRAASLSPEDDVIHSWIGRTFLNLGDIESAKREQKLLVELCKSKNEFFIAQCQARAQDLLKAIDQKAK